MIAPYHDEAGITIYHGDCRDVLPTLAAESVDMVLTDPPYGLDIGYGRTALGLRRIEGDATTDLLLWLVRETPRVLRDGTWAAVFCGYSQIGDVQAAAFSAGLGVKTVGIWDKGVPTLGEGIRNQYEMFMLARKGRAPEKWCGGNVWRHTTPPGRPVHPHAKPVPLLQRLVDNYAPAAGLVLDPCAGSGTTLRAAKDCGRRAVGIEINEAYCEEAAKRLAQGVLDFEEAAS